MLGGGGFGRPSGNLYKATLFGILGNVIPQAHNSEFEFWSGIGVYQLIVVDRERGLRSNPISISIEAPAVEDVEAGRLLATGGMRVLLSFQSVKHVGDASEVFERICDISPSSMYGRYAGMLLAIAKIEQTKAGTDSDARQRRVSAVVGLEKAASAFPAGHPLRSRGLFGIAQSGLRLDSGGGDSN